MKGIEFVLDTKSHKKMYNFTRNQKQPINENKNHKKNNFISILLATIK
jgi:flagellar hook assembly protein FlgD